MWKLYRFYTIDREGNTMRKNLEAISLGALALTIWITWQLSLIHIFCFRRQSCYSCRQMEIAAIQTHGLTRRFGELTAVEDVSLSVDQGQFFGFLGPNGAGKSTTIKMLTGLLEPTAGSIEILGQPFSSTALDLKRQIGVVPEGCLLYTSRCV